MDEHIVKPIPTTPTLSDTTEKTEAGKAEETTEGLQPESVKTSTEDPDDVASLIPQDDYRTSPLFYELANYFNLENSREMDQAKINVAQIIDWAIEETKSNKVEDILTKVRELEDKIERPQWGEKRYANLYRYIRLVSQRSAMDKAISAYERRS